MKISAVGEISMPVTCMFNSKKGNALRPYPMPGINTLLILGTALRNCSQAHTADSAGRRPHIAWLLTKAFSQIEFEGIIGVLMFGFVVTLLSRLSVVRMIQSLQPVPRNTFGLFSIVPFDSFIVCVPDAGYL